LKRVSVIDVNQFQIVSFHSADYCKEYRSIKGSTLLEVRPFDASVYTYFPCSVSLTDNCISTRGSIFLFRLVLSNSFSSVSLYISIYCV